MGFLYGPTEAIDYTLGVAAGMLYLYLLGKKVDRIGLKYSALQSNATVPETVETKLLDNAAKARLLVPVLVVALLAGKSVVIDGQTPQYFKLVPQSQFVSAMSGFLTVRFSIFLSEVVKEIRTEDWIGFVPGSVAIVIRNQWLKEKEERNATLSGEARKRDETNYKVVFVTGPGAAGRHELLSELMRSDPVVKGKGKFIGCKLLTSSAAKAGTGKGEWYDYSHSPSFSMCFISI